MKYDYELLIVMSDINTYYSVERSLDYLYAQNYKNYKILFIMHPMNVTANEIIRLWLSKHTDVDATFIISENCGSMSYCDFVDSVIINEIKKYSAENIWWMGGDVILYDETFLTKCMTTLENTDILKLNNIEYMKVDTTLVDDFDSDNKLSFMNLHSQFICKFDIFIECVHEIFEYIRTFDSKTDLHSIKYLVFNVFRIIEKYIAKYNTSVISDKVTIVLNSNNLFGIIVKYAIINNIIAESDNMVTGSTMYVENFFNYINNMRTNTELRVSFYTALLRYFLITMTTAFEFMKKYEANDYDTAGKIIYDERYNNTIYDFVYDENESIDFNHLLTFYII